MELERRLHSLEIGGSLKYYGVHEHQEYKKGSAVTYGGSLWVALRDTLAIETPPVMNGS
jgi:hypothetical protein